MARMRDSKPGNKSGGYARIFDDAALGELISKVHSTNISFGNELEDMIGNLVPNIENFDDFLKAEHVPKGVRLARKKHINRSRVLNLPDGIQAPDFMVFKKRNHKTACYIIEVKDGHVFDRQKAEAQYRALRMFKRANEPRLWLPINIRICGFNQLSQQAIWEGFKQRIPFKEVITGPDLGDLLEIDYPAMVQRRKEDCEDNVKYFFEEVNKLKTEELPRAAC